MKGLNEKDDLLCIYYVQPVTYSKASINISNYLFCLLSTYYMPTIGLADNLAVNKKDKAPMGAYFLVTDETIQTVVGTMKKR